MKTGEFICSILYGTYSSSNSNKVILTYILDITFINVFKPLIDPLISSLTVVIEKIILKNVFKKIYILIQTYIIEHQKYRQ